MPGPARAGAVIYAKDLARMAAFYETLLGMRRLHASPDHVVLESADIQLVIHGIPPHIAATFEISTPPEKREETAIKLFLTVPSLEAAAKAAPASRRPMRHSTSLPRPRCENFRSATARKQSGCAGIPPASG